MSDPGPASAPATELVEIIEPESELVRRPAPFPNRPHPVEVNPPPEEGPIPIDTVGQLLQQALFTAGIVGFDEDIEQEILSTAFRFANWLLSQWTRKRWLVYALSEYQFISTGAERYLVGDKQTVDINPRPDRLEYAFMRFLQHTSSPSQFPVDITLDIISSKEDYARITVKSVGTLPWRIFYDPQWPVGILYPWPVPQEGLYGIHVGFKTVLPRFQSLTQPINFPPEYEAALHFELARRYRVAFSLPSNPDLTSLARDAINTMRIANQAVWTQRMPPFLRGRNRAYDFRGDTG